MMHHQMNFSKSPVCNLTPGTVIVGKWHKNRYTLMRRLGFGATGAVYLSKDANGNKVAVKIGQDNMSITSEVNVLKTFSRVQGNVLGPSLIDVDDWYYEKKQYPFYAMEYLEGENVLSFMKGKREEWVGILLVQLLTDLERLHKAGWAFGDLKPDNLIVVGPPYRIRLIDVGGTTLIGRSIKEYTEFFDRGYWGLGSRRAEPEYDLFAACMIMLNMAYPARFEKKAQPEKQLAAAVNKSPLLKRYRKIVINGLFGKYNSAEKMRNDLVHTLSTYKKQAPVADQEAMSRSVRRSNQKKKKTKILFETLLLASFLFIVYMFYLVSQTM
ncbi:protein kinase domain-containing protein [Fictibacillus gelatini]|uniref:protein kinase domain-containing protein n=1 Tax=Fictibacillus gelatini TaxID=225985 RepID=UPI0004056AF9|nr:protein kinase family protein [Fictibacillus gelatini]